MNGVVAGTTAGVSSGGVSPATPAAGAGSSASLSSPEECTGEEGGDGGGDGKGREEERQPARYEATISAAIAIACGVSTFGSGGSELTYDDSVGDSCGGKTTSGRDGERMTGMNPLACPRATTVHQAVAWEGVGGSVEAVSVVAARGNPKSAEDLRALAFGSDFEAKAVICFSTICSRESEGSRAGSESNWERLDGFWIGPSAKAETCFSTICSTRSR